MKAVLLMVLIAVPVFASGMSVCREWEVVDAGPPASGDGGADDDGGFTDKQAADGGDAGPPSIYRAPPRRCLRYGFESYGERGCASVPGGSLLLLALLLARWRR